MKIYKHPLYNDQYEYGIFKIPMHTPNKILLAGTDSNNRISIWAEVDETSRIGTFSCQVVGTGHKPPPNPYIGTVLWGKFVSHLYNLGWEA